jgi:hypothetical protein
MSRVFRYSSSYIVQFPYIHITPNRLLDLQRPSFPLPVIDVLQNHLRRRFRGILATDTLNEVVIRIYGESSAFCHQAHILGGSLTHEVEVDAVVDEVILAGIHILRRTEVDTVLLANILDLLVCAGQADNAGVEFLQIIAQDVWCIANRVAGDKYGQEEALILGRCLDLLNDLSHLVELIRANIGAVSEAKVDLEMSGMVSANIPMMPPANSSFVRNTYEAVFALQILCGKLLPVKVLQHKRTANLRPSNTLAHLRHALPFQTGFLNAEVEHHTSTGQHEEQRGLPRKWTVRVTLAQLAHCLAFLAERRS